MTYSDEELQEKICFVLNAETRGNDKLRVTRLIEAHSAKEAWGEAIKMATVEKWFIHDIHRL